jgi:hypothetical protein
VVEDQAESNTEESRPVSKVAVRLAKKNPYLRAESYFNSGGATKMKKGSERVQRRTPLMKKGMRLGGVNHTEGDEPKGAPI